MSGGRDVDLVVEKDATPAAPRVVSRREMLGVLGGWLGGALVGATVLGAGEAFAEGDHAEHLEHRYGMVIDTVRCVGCSACVVACKQENVTPPGVDYNVVLHEVTGVSGTADVQGRPTFVSKPCFHCEHPSCTGVCPVGATFKRAQDGIVVVDYDRCIGCRYCMTACPYQARYFDYGDDYPAVEQETPYAAVRSPEYTQYRDRAKGGSPIGNVRKCSFCLHLQDEEGAYSKAEGRWPACAKTCTGHAIHFGDLLDPDDEVSSLLRERTAVRLKEEIGNEPTVYYLV